MKLRSYLRLCLTLYLGLLPMLIPAGEADGAPSAPYRTSLTLWRAAYGQLDGWERTGVVPTGGGALEMDRATAQRSADPYKLAAYKGRNFYNGGTFLVGETLSPVTAASFPFTQAVVSWNADTPAGTWLETQMRARTGSGSQGGWTRWYSFGVWAAGNSTVQRHSVDGQADSDGDVSTDTLVLGTSGAPITADAFQVKVRLFSDTGVNLPRLRMVAVTLSTTPAPPTTLPAGKPEFWGKRIQVPECSQMLYKDGGEAWCSPTTISMLFAYWKADGAPCEARIRASVAGVNDWVYDGDGNWPFNTAYAATQGYEGYVTRLTSFAEAEPWIAAGVPLVISFGWNRGELTGAPIPTSEGHIALLVGFDASGNPIVNDPAAATDAGVQRTYNRAELERLWLAHSGGTVYVIYPQGWPYGHYPLARYRFM